MKYTLLLFFFISTFTLFSQNKNHSIGFKENKGQIMDQKGKPNTAVKYLLNSNGLNVQLKKNGFSYDIYEVKKIPISLSKTSKTLPYQIPEKDKDKEPEFNLEYKFHRVDIDFVNSNSKVALITDQVSKDFDNYYNIPNQPEGIVGVHQYKQITYKNIYPNIDVVFTIPDDTQKTVEYNFVIHPKGKISDIQLKFNGSETDLVDNKIQMNVRFGKMEETLPASWIEDRTAKKEVAVEYRKIKKNVYGFSSSDTTSDKTVIIDPVPVRLWGTYHSGPSFESSDHPLTIISDSQNNVIITGGTYLTSDIATSGTFQSTNISNRDTGFIVKFDSDGIRLWGTYINYSIIADAKVNSSNEIYIVGRGKNIGSNSLSTADGHKQLSDGLMGEGILLKFNSNGQRIWGTFYGGEENGSLNGLDNVNTIALDNQENIVIAGETHSKTGMTTSNAYQQNIIDYFDGSGFIAKFTPAGIRTYGSYFQGIIKHSAIDSNNNLIFAGQYSQYDSGYPNITTTGAYQNQIHGMDGFIVKFNSSGHQVTWCTYYGGDASFSNSVNDYYDQIKGLGVDSSNNIYIVGLTNSTNLIATTGSYKETLTSNNVDCFIAKFNSFGKIEWGTYYGSNVALQNTDKCRSGFVTPNGDIFITGNTRSNLDIATPDSYQETLNDSDEGFMAKFSTNGSLLWGSYYGSSSQDFPQDIFYNDNKLYIIGHTSYSTSIVPNYFGTSGTHQPKGTGIFLAKFQDCLSNPLVSSNSPVCIGKTLELKASGGTNYFWSGPNGFTSTDQNPTIINVTTANSGEYSCLITGTGGCDDTKKVNIVIGDIQSPVPDITTLPTITGDCHTTINTNPTATDACAGIIIGITTDPLSYTIPGTYTIVWNYNDGNGNVSHQNQTVIITSQPLAVANSPQTFCMLKNATLADIAITGQNIKWYNNLTTGIFLPQTNTLQNGLIYYASQTINGCESARIPVTINIQNTLLPTGNSNQSFCTAQNPTIADIQITGQNIKWYDAVSNGSLLAETTNLVNGRTYYASQTENNCEGQRLGITVSIVNTPPAPTGNGTQSFCKNENATLSSIQISGQDIKWYNTNFSAASLPNSTLLEDNTTYYASQTIGCEGDRTTILVRVYDTPLPTANRNQQFCIDENATIANLNITGTALKWYDSATNGNILTQTTSLQNKAYYVTQTLNNCESERLAVNVKIQDTQVPIADSPQIFCIQENAKISNIEISGQNIQWFESTSSTVPLSGSTLLENGVTYYASQTINNCEGDRIPVLINILGATTADCINFVEELPYPKFFTPNNDYHNDTWTIDFAYLKPNTGIRIFDRYGKFLKEIRPNSEWDGTYIGQDMPASDYWFTVTRFNGTEYRGHFSLKR
nr:T9SS type B sorting domain-containing protein [uncultured Flavobacterium sp.]